ncbi:pli1 [Symbiodinium sp. CCMP2592]|nr:pli1 [Symbiodinium sp. CCMP2592]
MSVSRQVVHAPPTPPTACPLRRDAGLRHLAAADVSVKFKVRPHGGSSNMSVSRQAAVADSCDCGASALRLWKEVFCTSAAPGPAREEGHRRRDVPQELTYQLMAGPNVLQLRVNASAAGAGLALGVLRWLCGDVPRT